MSINLILIELERFRLISDRKDSTQENSISMHLDKVTLTCLRRRLGQRLIQLSQMSETFAKQKRDLDLQAGKTGAFGDRSGIEQAELTRGEARERGNILSQAGRQGLEFAASQYERDRQAAERAFQLGGEERRTNFDLNQASRRMELEAQQSLAPQVQEAQGLIGAGEAERLLDQQALEIAYRDYVEQREYPFTALNFAIGALKGLPFETREFTMQRGGEFIQSPSVYGQTMGGLGALASAYKLLS